jgi:phage gpG-like protein
VPVSRVGDWALAARILAPGAARRVRRAIDRAVLQEAHFLAREIKAGLVSQTPGGQAFRPLAPSTLAVRRFKRFRGTKALLNRGDLRNSITVRSETLGAFVGVLRTARGRDGAPLANVAELNEWGSRPIVIQVTPKMRRFLAAAMRSTGGGHNFTGGGGASTGFGVIVVQIPARPFIRPVADQHYGNETEVAQRFLHRVGTLLGGDFGGPGVRPSGRGSAGGLVVGGGTRAGGSGASISWLSRLFRGGSEGPERDPTTGRFRRR